jgi:hypothetical protein
VLRSAEEKLNAGRLIARTPTFALLRSPTVLVVGGQHQDVYLFYAFLVDAESGSLTTLVWASPVERPTAPSTIVKLPADLEMPVALDVRVIQSIGPIPLSWSFAMPTLPPGRPLVVPSAVARLLSTQPYQPAAMERALKSLAAAPAPEPARVANGGSGPGRRG